MHIVVDAQDKWTLQVTARARLDDGFEFNGIDVSEQNVAGKGIAVGAYYNELREQRELGGRNPNSTLPRHAHECTSSGREGPA